MNKLGSVTDLSSAKGRRFSLILAEYLSRKRKTKTYTWIYKKCPPGG